MEVGNRFNLVGIFILCNIWYLAVANPLQSHHGTLRGAFEISNLRRHSESLPDYQPLCQSIKHKVELSKEGYEFRPPFYHTVVCTNSTSHNYNHHRTGKLQGSQACLQSEMACVQQYRTIQVAKRRIGSPCWSLFHHTIHSGCDCMWPVNTLGDSALHF